MWTFLWYPDGTKDPWATWYWQQSASVRAKHDRAIAFLQAREIHDWREPYSKSLEGYDDLFEILIKADVQHRLLGTFRPGKRFLIVQPCTHKGKNYKPKGAFKVAQKRITEINNGEKLPIICAPPQTD